MGKWFEYDPLTGIREENISDEWTDKVTVRKTQDVQGLLDRNAYLRNTGATDIGIKKGLWHYCSIPLVVQYELLSKYGLNIPKQEPHRQNISGHKSRFSVLKDDGKNPLADANRLTREGKLAEAWAIAERHLAEENPDSLVALTIGLDVWRKQNKPAVAYQFAARVTELAPEDPVAWSNRGMIADSLYRFDEAERCFQKAVSFCGSDKEKGGTFTNWACMLINKGDWEVAEKMARRALKHNPDSIKCKANLGICLVGMRQYREGWPLYDSVIGFDQSRRRQQYKDEQPWDGTKGQSIVVYGEQGLGDEIKFSSVLPDAIRDSKSVTVDCTDRLVGLFKRSFPQATIHGTRWEQKLKWNPGEIDASISVGGLSKFYRNEVEDFPRTPYLVADPDRVEMWKGLFQKQGKPVIGIAWSGGVPWTADRFRRWKLDDLLPLFRSVDAVWVCLEYKDASKEIAAFKAEHPEIDLRQFAFGTLTDDYDDTAALVSALDLVVAMQTSVIHLAGALGKDCWCFVNKHGQAHYGVPPQDFMDWYGSVKLYRQGKDGKWPIEQAAKDLPEYLAQGAEMPTCP